MIRQAAELAQGKTCQHVLEKIGPDRVYCGKPAKFTHTEYGWILCGVHARFWRNRGFEVTP